MRMRDSGENVVDVKVHLGSDIGQLRWATKGAGYV
jgi:hypothetical protein